MYSNQRRGGDAGPVAALFAIRPYRNLFAAQVVALFGTGMATVALGLLAYEFAGSHAAAVLGTALTIKMVAYVVVAPLAAAYVDLVPRRALLIGLDVVRATAAVGLLWVTQVWQIYLIIAVLQAASAAFTPTFQAVIPDVVRDEKLYTRALSASQLATTMESLLSPVFAGILLTLVNFHWLFSFTVVGFLGSAILVVTTAVPDSVASTHSGVVDRTVSGIRVFVRTPRLRGILGLNLAVASAGSIIVVSTVNLVRDQLGGRQADVAWLLAAAGLATMLAALVMPRVLERAPERRVMITGGVVLVAAIPAAVLTLRASGWTAWACVAAIWFAIGAGSAVILTPLGRVLRTSSAPADRAAVFAAQFSLSHLCWLLTYPIAGWGGAAFGFAATWTVLGGFALLGLGFAAHAWPRRDAAELDHVHDASETPADHLVGAVAVGGGEYRHRHQFVIDNEHMRWPH